MTGTTSPRRTLVVSDLDRTLIYSPSALQLAGPDEDAPTLVCVEVVDGRPHSFLTLAAAESLGRIHRAAVFVPTTTRTVAQYRRVHFPGIRPRWAVTSNGGHLLEDGRVDPAWNRHVRQAIAGDGTDLAEVIAELKLRADGDWVLKRRVGDELFCYLVVDVEALPPGFVPEWRQWCTERNWSVSMQGRKIYAIPRSLSKESAVREVARRAGTDRTVAAGDGALDAGVLVAADRSIRPPHGELDATGWAHPGVEVSGRAGVLAADDITAWFEDQLRPSSP
ncbi:HAD family hydrolase [Nakamurella endophytica]|uniref:HAD family hydrolase n=1 Tax=Nakamurella endophytica TaxID=1748367 RepID=A0A917WE73_9ACTN|nr:HAD family hydrolase [Nakamurella endophytica]GGL97327.1 hypothetical protein GCM10011594_16320 [Nakamurella endophytica]